MGFMDLFRRLHSKEHCHGNHSVGGEALACAADHTSSGIRAHVCVSETRPLIISPGASAASERARLCSVLAASRALPRPRGVSAAILLFNPPFDPSPERLPCLFRGIRKRCRGNPFEETSQDGKGRFCFELPELTFKRCILGVCVGRRSSFISSVCWFRSHDCH